MNRIGEQDITMASNVLIHTWLQPGDKGKAAFLGNR